MARLPRVRRKLPDQFPGKGTPGESPYAWAARRVDQVAAGSREAQVHFCAVTVRGADRAGDRALVHYPGPRGSHGQALPGPREVAAHGGCSGGRHRQGRTLRRHACGQPGLARGRTQAGAGAQGEAPRAERAGEARHAAGEAPPVTILFKNGYTVFFEPMRRVFLMVERRSTRLNESPGRNGAAAQKRVGATGARRSRADAWLYRIAAGPSTRRKPAASI